MRLAEWRTNWRPPLSAVAKHLKLLGPTPGMELVIPPPMTQPRIVLPRKTYLFTRCTILQHLLLRPSDDLTRIILYVLAVVANELEIQVHALCTMSDHIHIVATDTAGNFPKFLQRFHRNVSLATAALLKWRGPVFENKQASVVALETPQSVIEKIVYVLANPVRAGLVKHANQWPGAKTLVTDIGQNLMRIARPGVYFDPQNEQWPEVAELHIALPPHVDECDADGFRQTISAELERTETAIQVRMRQEGRSFLGAERAKMVSPYDRATSVKPHGNINPTFAVGRHNGQARRKALQHQRSFRLQYRRAIEQWHKDKRKAVFPEGTWWMRIFHKARITPDPPDVIYSAQAA